MRLLRSSLLSTLVLISLSSIVLADPLITVDTSAMTRLAHTKIHERYPAVDLRDLSLAEITYRYAPATEVDAEYKTLSAFFRVKSTVQTIEDADGKRLQYDQIQVLFGPDGRPVNAHRARATRTLALPATGPGIVAPLTESGVSRLHSFNFERTPLAEVLQYYANISRKQIEIQAGDATRVSASGQGLSRAEAMTAIENALARVGLELREEPNGNLAVFWRLPDRPVTPPVAP